MSVVTRATLRRSAAVIVLAGGLTAGVTAPAMAANNNTRQGLANVNLQNVTAQIPIGIAANVCNVGANVLASALANGAAPCNAVANPSANG